jgi:hypothetical protein
MTAGDGCRWMRWGGKMAMALCGCSVMIGDTALVDLFGDNQVQDTSQQSLTSLGQQSIAWRSRLTMIINSRSVKSAVMSVAYAAVALSVRLGAIEDRLIELTRETQDRLSAIRGEIPRGELSGGSHAEVMSCSVRGL